MLDEQDENEDRQRVWFAGRFVGDDTDRAIQAKLLASASGSNKMVFLRRQPSLDPERNLDSGVLIGLNE